MQCREINLTFNQAFRLEPDPAGASGAAAEKDAGYGWPRAGHHVFEVEGDITVRIREGKRWPLVAPAVAKEKLIPYLHTLEVIEHGDPWRLRFRAGDRNATVALQATVTRIIWHPDG